MRTSDRILRQVRRALIAAFALSGCAALLTAVLALHALPLLSRELSLMQPERLWLLASSAAVIALVLLCMSAARARVLQRAGLWLDHTLAHHVLLAGARAGVPANTLRGDWAAIARLRDALTGHAVLPVLEAPWTVLALAVLAMLHPILAAVVAASAIALIMTAAAQAAPVARLDQQRLRASERVAQWWRHLPASPLPAEAAPHWEKLNRAHVAAAYLLDRRVLALRDLAHAVRALALAAAILAGVWLVSTGELTVGALVAGVALVALTLAPFVGLIVHLKTARRALIDYRRLANRPEATRSASLAPADAPHMPLPAFTAPVPRLYIGGPLALGFGAALLLIAAGTGAVTLLPQQITSLAAEAHAAPRAVPVKHSKGGIAARLHVAQGAEVKAGDILITLDTTSLDRLIAALKADADVVQRQLEMVSREATDLAALSPATISERIKLRALEEQIAALRARSETLPGRIAEAELDLARSVIRAPVSGRIVALSVHAPSDTIVPGAVIAEIAPAEQPGLIAQLAEPWLRKMHRMLRSLYQENAA